MIEVRRYTDARVFLERAETWLLRHEIENAVVLVSAQQARIDDRRYERPIYWATLEDGGEIIGCACRTPPYKVGVTQLPTTAIAPLVADLDATYPTVSGFSGPEPTVHAVAAAWTAKRGGSTSLGPRQRLLELPPVTSAEPAGTLRLAGRNDVALAQSWGAAASLDSGIEAFGSELCVQLVGAKRLYFFVHDQPRCMLGVLRETPQSVALGIVYTPAAFRSQGYASAAIAALHELLDERGVAKRYLYIDPTNDAVQGLARKIGATLVQDALDIDCR
jgi:RimJ/RimL family protein N-acetyltransferase